MYNITLQPGHPVQKAGLVQLEQRLISFSLIFQCSFPVTFRSRSSLVAVLCFLSFCNSTGINDRSFLWTFIWFVDYQGQYSHRQFSFSQELILVVVGFFRFHCDHTVLQKATRYFRIVSIFVLEFMYAQLLIPNC